MDWLQMLEATTYTGPNLAITTDVYLAVEEKFGTEGVATLSLYVENGEPMPEYLVSFIQGLKVPEHLGPEHYRMVTS